ncbi:MAG: hypothetical protein MN733_00725, partial [Nitrososphaera sp.]|nr:hypothetical protein [Nitrososphaera sp.]
MKKICLHALLVSVFFFFPDSHYAARVVEHGTIFYVSPNGNDAWSGKSAAANVTKANGPFATIERARNAIRDLKKQGPLTEPITVYIRGGLYVLREPLVFTSEDSGTGESAITYAAYPRETPVVSGERRITGWKKLTEEVGSIDAKARGKLWIADVPKGWKFNQLFLDGKRLPRSATPNGDRWEHWFKAKAEGNKVVLRFSADTINQWPSSKNMEVNFLFARWMNMIVPINTWLRSNIPS